MSAQPSPIGLPKQGRYDRSISPDSSSLPPPTHLINHDLDAGDRGGVIARVCGGREECARAQREAVRIDKGVHVEVAAAIVIDAEPARRIHASPFPPFLPFLFCSSKGEEAPARLLE